MVSDALTDVNVLPMEEDVREGSAKIPLAPKSDAASTISHSTGKSSGVPIPIAAKVSLLPNFLDSSPTRYANVALSAAGETDLFTWASDGLPSERNTNIRAKDALVLRVKRVSAFCRLGK